MEPPSSPAIAPSDGIMEDLVAPAVESGPSNSGAGATGSGSGAPAPKRVKRPKLPKLPEGDLVPYTTAIVPGLWNIKNPAGDYAQHDRNVEVFRQVSQAKARKEKEAVVAEKEKAVAEGQEIIEEHPLKHTLIIHPGSRNLRIGRASDFYPKEVPNCIARPAKDLPKDRDPPVPGSRLKRAYEEERTRKRAKLDDANGVEMNGNGHHRDPIDENIGHLRDYLRNRLIANKLATDYREGTRVKASNAKARPESIPEHNDPYRIDWTEVDGKNYVVGVDALRIPDSAGYKIRYPILNRTLNKRDWVSSQQLMDDIEIILTEALRTELGIAPREFHKYSILFIVPDHDDRTYVQEMTHLLLSVMNFKEIAIHQEAYCAIFSAGMSSACVVDIGAQQTSITFVDEGLVNSDTRVRLDYGGDDITSAMVSLLERSNFPYRSLDLARSQEWLMMDNLKIKICTLEEHLVANTAWDFYLLKAEGLTEKYIFRTYDENILAPLCFFDTRMIDFEEKRGQGEFQFWNTSDDITDLLTTQYDEPTGAMRQLTQHLLPAVPIVSAAPAPPVKAESALPPVDTATTPATPSDQIIAEIPHQTVSSAMTPLDSTDDGEGDETLGQISTPKPKVEQEQQFTYDWSNVDFDIVEEASKAPLDGAIAAAIAMAGTENKVKAASMSILLIGGTSALKGLGAFVSERLPPLLRAKGIPTDHVSTVPPPRGLNPRFVSWKGASVICNLETLGGDMWIRRDEWEAIGARALKDRCMFL